MIIKHDKGEKKAGRLFWIDCQLHTNEMKLMRLINMKDGKTSRPGWIGVRVAHWLLPELPDAGMWQNWAN